MLSVVRGGASRDDEDVSVALRSYPHHLTERVRWAWPQGGMPLPRNLESLLDVAYHASFLRDETRPVTCRIMIAPPSMLAYEGGPPNALLPLRFEEPRAYTENELRRLSPAAKFQRALIGVDADGDSPLTWGLVQSGPRWMQTARGGRAKEAPMPRCLVIRVVRPGHIIVACGNKLVAELRGGRLSDFALDVFQSEWLPALFRGERKVMATEHVTGEAESKIAEESAATLTRYLAQQMIKRVVATMRSAHHGGTLLVVPPDCSTWNYLQTKYDFESSEPRRHFRRLVLTILETLAERAAATGRPPDAELYRHDTDARLADLDEGLFEMSNLIAALADVDGAVVLTKRFEILGFGAEIAGDLPRVDEVRRAIDLEGTRCATEVAEAVGTRHRSAYRFCAAAPGALAIVVSQDGGVRFVTMHRDAVTYWDHGPGDD
jgi:hypothetical protein